MSLDPTINEAAAAIARADALVVAAGAGMGVDSGLPDFRGPEGFWRAYPQLEAQGLDFYAMANPRTFRDQPRLAWQFYGHRQALYRDTPPHAGFAILLSWCERAGDGYFVFTSNVDGHFQKAGFDAARIFECHGNIYALQCQVPCSNELWEPDAAVDYTGELPVCPRCDGPSRPNVLMFGDFGWISEVSEAQHRRYREWLRTNRGRELVVIEIGAGCAVPTVRLESETLRSGHDATLIRINPREPEGPAGTIELPLGGLEAVERIAAALKAGQ